MKRGLFVLCLVAATGFGFAVTKFVFARQSHSPPMSKAQAAVDARSEGLRREGSASAQRRGVRGRFVAPRRWSSAASSNRLRLIDRDRFHGLATWSAAGRAVTSLVEARVDAHDTLPGDCFGGSRPPEDGVRFSYRFTATEEAVRIDQLRVHDDIDRAIAGCLDDYFAGDAVQVRQGIEPKFLPFEGTEPYEMPAWMFDTGEAQSP